jgi:hypothetical protein
MIAVTARYTLVMTAVVATRSATSSANQASHPRSANEGALHLPHSLTTKYRQTIGQKTAQRSFDRQPA